MPSAKHKILLIDDDPFLLAMYGRKFMAAGFIVHGAQTAAEGLAEAKRLTPDIVLLDIMLPDEDGLSVLKKLRRHKETAALKVCMLSNIGQSSYREQALILGANGYLVKAYCDPSEVVEKVQEIISAPKAKK